MRLICGFLHLDDRPAGRHRLDEMVRAMIAPGLAPGVAYFVQGPVGLATLDFTDVAITPARNGSGLALAADVRLDAREGLAGSMGTVAPPACSTGDESLLLATLERWGGNGLKRLLGDFAFAAWDQNTRSLLCARDAMGVRPFYFVHAAGDSFAFASRPSALRAGGFVGKDLDEEFLLGALVGAHFGPERSLFRGVERLAPGGLLYVSSDRMERRRHWDVDRRSAGRRVIGPDEAAEQLSALVTEAVRCRLPASGPVAAHLSGGLDSSALTVLAARALRTQGRELLGYSFMPTAVGVHEPAGERPYVEAVLRQEPGIAWTPIRITDPSAYVLPAMDLDLALPYTPVEPEAQIFIDAAARGAQVLLSGWGGDEAATFNGRGALAEALLAGHWGNLAGECKALSAERGWSLLEVLRREALHYLLPEQWGRLIRRLRGRPTATGATAAEMLKEQIAARIKGGKVRIGPNAAANRVSLLSGGHLARRAEGWAEMGARHGLAVAFPLLDRRVVEFALSLPSALFYRGSWPRRVFRDAMAGILPPEIRWRRDKLIPFPQGPLLVAAQRASLLECLDELRGHARVADLFDLERLEEEVRALPTVETVTHQAAALSEVSMFGLRTSRILRVFRYALYVQQHH